MERIEKTLLLPLLAAAVLSSASCSDDKEKEPPVRAVNYTIEFTTVSQAVYLGDKYQTGDGNYRLTLTNADGDVLEADLTSVKAPQTLRRNARSGRLHGGGDPPGGNVRAGGILVGNRQKRRRGPERESGGAEKEIRDPRGQHDVRARSIGRRDLHPVGRRDLHPVGRGDRRGQNRPLVLVERRAGLRKRIRRGRPGRVRTAVDGLRRLLSRRLRHCGRHLHAPRRQRKGRTAFAAPQRAVAGQRRRCPATANTRSTCARKRENTPTRPSRSAQATSPRAAGPPAPTGKPTKPPTSPRRDRSPSRPSAKAGR